MPATPVLQNAWANAGVTAAIDYGHAQGENAWAAALAWAPRQSRFQLSVGGGAINDSAATRSGYGGRISIPVRQFAGGSIGTGVFAGVGFTSKAAARESNFPVGASFGFRHALGATRGISAYVAPFWVLTRFKQDTVSRTRGLVRGSVGVDVTLASQLGLTIGYEDGARAKGIDPGARGGVFGIALSYALRRQQ
ncbi:MAG: hypothetical protein HOQ09_12170 [Gemmatimonadaceae bacterium]|nr:hypothetical protein [Gemmatimonadaceae bacterium]